VGANKQRTVRIYGELDTLLLQFPQTKKVKPAHRRHEFDPPTQNFEFERRVEVVARLPVYREVIETSVAKCDLVCKVGMEVVAGVTRHSDD
jgi:hypothetical protein